MSYTTTYQEIKKLQPIRIRTIARNYALNGLNLLEQLRGMEEAFCKPRVQFIFFHHVFKDEIENLRQILTHLSKNHTFITYSEAVERVLNNEIDKPYISFSSDDGFKNNMDAAKIFSEFGISVCFFINPTLINETNFHTIQTHCRDRLHLPPIEFLTWTEVNNIQKLGHEIGSHTMQHICIPDYSEAHIIDDMHKTYAVLSKYCGGVTHFAYPYGRFFHFTENARKAVFEAGFKSCASAERGCHIVQHNTLKREDFFIRRDQVIFHENINHLFYFIARNARNASFTNNLFPV